MTGMPPDFGGFLAWWDDGRAHVVRFGEGEPLEGLRLTPLNLLQVRKTLDELIATGERDGHISEEHRRQSGLLPTSRGVENILGRREVDDIAGEG